MAKAQEGPAPIMPDNHGPFAPQVANHGRDVADELRHGVVFNALGLVAFVVAPRVDGHDLIVLGQLGHLGSPRVPEIGEAVDHYHKWSLAQCHVVDFHTIGIGEPFCCCIQGIVGHRESASW